MDPLFVVDARHHGKGPVIFAWHPQGTLLATSGSNRMVHIFTCHGQLLHTIKSLPTTRCVPDGVSHCLVVPAKVDGWTTVVLSKDIAAGHDVYVFF